MKDVTQTGARFVAQTVINLRYCDQVNRYAHMYDLALKNVRATQQDLRGFRGFRNQAVDIFLDWRYGSLEKLPSWDRNVN